MEENTEPIAVKQPAATVTNQTWSPAEAFPEIPDPAGHDKALSSPPSPPPVVAHSAARQSQSGNQTDQPAAAGPSSSSGESSTLVWLPPSQYSAIRDKWQDQFIWSPTAFASDLPVSQTSFIGVGRSRVDSAVTKPPFPPAHAANGGAPVAAWRRVAPAATTLGDVVDATVSQTLDDEAARGTDEQERPSHEADSPQIRGVAARHPVPGQHSGATSKFTKKRPAKMKHWHSFHLLKNSGPRSRKNSSSQSSNEGSSEKVADMPSMPRRSAGGVRAQIGRRGGMGRIPVLVPHPKSYEEAEKKKMEIKDARDRHGKASRQSKDSSGISKDGIPVQGSAALPSAHAEYSSQSETVEAAESTIRDAARKTRGTTRRIIVAELPEDNKTTPRRPLVLPTLSGEPRQPLVSSQNSNLQVPPEHQSRGRKARQSPVRRAAHCRNRQLRQRQQQQETITPGAVASSEPGPSGIRSSRQPPIAPQVLPANSPSPIFISKNGIVPNSPSARADPTTAITKQKPSSSQLSISLNINLDLEVHLKAKLHGDVTLSLFE
ncbi:hypothetical protein MN608_06606 [Microdochium nivale]|nr:hypothetical protein MN608_06606 [Microdochium nivale]